MRKLLLIGLLTLSLMGCGKPKLSKEFIDIAVAKKDLTLMPTIASEIEGGVPFTVIALRKGSNKFEMFADACTVHKKRSNGELKCKGNDGTTSCSLQPLEFENEGHNLVVRKATIEGVIEEYKKIKN